MYDMKALYEAESVEHAVALLVCFLLHQERVSQIEHGIC